MNTPWLTLWLLACAFPPNECFDTARPEPHIELIGDRAADGNLILHLERTTSGSVKGRLQVILENAGSALAYSISIDNSILSENLVSTTPSERPLDFSFFTSDANEMDGKLGIISLYYYNDFNISEPVWIEYHRDSYED